MSMYDRFAKDLSPGLFDSIYASLQAKAEREQSTIYATCRKRGKAGKAPADYRIGEAQNKFTAFCEGKLSLGEALDYAALA